MRIDELYEMTGDNYANVLERFGNEETLAYIMRKFPRDPNFRELKRALESGDNEKAFRAAHTLKGISLNLGFDGMNKPLSVLTEILRGRASGNTAELFSEVEKEYDRIVELIAVMDENLSS